MSANVTFSDDDDDDDEDAMPWERYNWVPLQKCGKQKTPNMVSELKRNVIIVIVLDDCCMFVGH